MKKIKVVHIIPMLGPGGAERVAVHIVKGLNRHRFDPRVISIWRRVGCDLETQLDDAGVPVQYLGKGPGFDGRAYHRLHRALRTLRPKLSIATCTCFVTLCPRCSCSRACRRCTRYTTSPNAKSNRARDVSSATLLTTASSLSPFPTKLHTV